MIAKTFFLMKIIHRIGIRSFRQEKSLRENLAGYRIFFTLRQLGRQLSIIFWTSGSGVSPDAEPAADPQVIGLASVKTETAL
jgi:hypothetical protein